MASTRRIMKKCMAEKCDREVVRRDSFLGAPQIAGTSG